MICYNFYNPTRLVFGEDSIAKIGNFIADGGYHKVLLIAGGGSIKKNGVYDTAISSLRENQISVVECWGVRANPCLEKVREAIAIAKAEKVDAVLAIGGGSVIDTAKAVAAGVFARDIWQVFEHKEKIVDALPIFTILTLSATASEMNCNTVVSNESEGKKYGTGHPLLYPKVSIIEPSVQNTLPWNQTVNGALDAMAHIMEYYFVGTVEETVLSVNEALLKSITKAMSKLKTKQDDSIARANLAWAATMALNGTSGAGLKGGDWACHDMSHSVSSMYPEIAHGAALGVIFPAWMEFMWEEEIAQPQFDRFAKAVFDVIDIEEGIVKFRNLIKAWGGNTKLSELGVKVEDIPQLAQLAVDRGPIGNLYKLEEKDVERILRLAY